MIMILEYFHKQLKRSINKNSVQKLCIQFMVRLYSFLPMIRFMVKPNRNFKVSRSCSSSFYFLHCCEHFLSTQKESLHGTGFLDCTHSIKITTREARKF